MGKPSKYTKVKTVKISLEQHETLKKISGYNINVCKFIREAIAEKIDREHANLKPKPKNEYCPF